MLQLILLNTQIYQVLADSPEKNEQDNVSAGNVQWFYPTPDRRYTALRYFINTDGWNPEYTDTPILFRSTLGV